jgi:hypothetical protein
MLVALGLLGAVAKIEQPGDRAISNLPRMASGSVDAWTEVAPRSLPDEMPVCPQGLLGGCINDGRGCRGPWRRHAPRAPGGAHQSQTSAEECVAAPSSVNMSDKTRRSGPCRFRKVARSATSPQTNQGWNQSQRSNRLHREPGDCVQGRESCRGFNQRRGTPND